MAAEYSTENIVVLEGLEPVRLRPGMYIGGTDAHGLHHMAMEIVGNSLDQVLAGYAHTLRVDLDEHGWLTVEDDGHGIPIETMRGMPFLELIFTHLSHFPTVDGHTPHVHIAPKLVGVGVAPVCALSARLEVESRVAGRIWRAAFERGVCVEHLSDHGATSATGTRVRLLPDEQIFEGRKIDAERLRVRLEELALLLSDLRLHFQGRDLSNKAGLRGLLLHHAPDVVPATLLTKRETIGDILVEFAIGWSPTRTNSLRASFVNLTRTERGGTHEAALTSALRSSAPSHDLWEATKNGFASIVHVGLLHPRFGGPTKAMLDSEEAIPAVTTAVTSVLTPAIWEVIQRAMQARPSP